MGISLVDFAEVGGVRARGSIRSSASRVYTQLIFNGTQHYMPVHDGVKFGVDLTNLAGHMVAVPAVLVAADCSVRNTYEASRLTDPRDFESDSMLELGETGGRHMRTSIDGFLLPENQKRPFVFDDDGSVSRNRICVFVRKPLTPNMTMSMLTHLQSQSGSRGSISAGEPVISERTQTGVGYHPEAELVIDLAVISFREAEQMLTDADVSLPDDWHFSRMAEDGK